MTLRLESLRQPLADFILEIDVTLSARSTAIFGPSGSGKTSLLETIAGLRKLVSGKITLDASVLTDTPAKISLPPQHRHVGYVPQEGALFPHLSARENLLYGVREKREPSDAFTLDHVANVLEIRPLLDRRIDSLSGGEKQRVALGRALLPRPRLLLLDEPLASLDTELRERLINFLTRIRETFDIPMLYVTHSPDEVVALCEHVVVLERGRVVQSGSVQEIFRVSAKPRYELQTPRSPHAAR